jgi:hypothetical protein
MAMSKRGFKIGQSLCYRKARGSGRYVVLAVLRQTRGEVCYRIRSQDDELVERVARKRTEHHVAASMAKPKQPHGPPMMLGNVRARLTPGVAAACIAAIISGCASEDILSPYAEPGRYDFLDCMRAGRAQRVDRVVPFFLKRLLAMDSGDDTAPR